MTDRALRDADQRLLETILRFVGPHPHADVRRFADTVADWGREWREVEPCALPAADLLAEASVSAAPETRDLLAAFAREKASRKWEQTCTRDDPAVSGAMLASYAFAEVIGARGPFLNSRVRAGIGVWAAGLKYPLHHHTAEEVYVVVAGGTEFRLAGGDRLTAAYRRAGDVVHVPSRLVHGFRTAVEPLVVFYMWQNGDLREKSRFAG